MAGRRYILSIPCHGFNSDIELLIDIKYMGVRKYKYYFKKPKSEITKDVFRWLMIAGAVGIAATSPYFVSNLLAAHKKFNKYPKQRIQNTFYKFKKQGLINIRTANHQIYISLTKDGKKKAGWLQIDCLKVAKPKRWDKKWRLALFDISQNKKLSREALRGKLKEMGFLPFQKSAWIHPFDCEAEIELLRKFFGLSEEELRLILAESIGSETEWRRVFKII